MITTTFRNPLAAALAAAMLLSAAFLSAAPRAHASPLYYAPTAQTSSATTSPAYMTPGAATSTLVYDAGVTARQNVAIDRAILLTQVRASSTASRFSIAFEYSQGVAGTDCSATPSACDWYADNALALTNATTSQPFTVALPNAYVWTYASTTQGGGAVLPDSNRGLKALTVPILARYTRVIYSVTGAAGSVWGQMVPVRQVQ
jgi:hypothetical protein